MGVRRYDSADDIDLEAHQSPIAVQFDRGVALTGYVLLFTALFTAGLTSLGAFALASAHTRDSHLVTRTHYKYQLSIFWTGIFAFGLAILCGFIAAALGLSQFFGWLEIHVRWVADLIGDVSLPGNRGQTAGWFAVGGLVLLAYGMLHTAVSSIWGALKLVRGRPIGHIDED